MVSSKTKFQFKKKQNLLLNKIEKFVLFARQGKKEYSILINIGNENKQMWFASKKEVRLMIDTGYLIVIIYILYRGLIGMTIIALSSIVAFVILLIKSKNQ